MRALGRLLQALLLSLIASSALGGGFISPDLPFMLFASDNVTDISLREPVCVFVASSSKLDLSKITFKTSNLNGAVDSPVSAKSFMRPLAKPNAAFSYNQVYFGARCFSASASILSIDYSNLYGTLNSSSVEWRSTVLYFMSKSQTLGACKKQGTMQLGGNVYVIDSNGFLPNVSASVECPAVVLIPDNLNADLSDECQVINFLTASGVEQRVNLTKLSSDVDVLTAQWGIAANNPQNPLMFSFNQSTASSQSGLMFLRNAVELRVKSTAFVQNFIGIEMVNSGYSICTLTRDLSDDMDSGATKFSGVVDSDPFGLESFKHNIQLPFFQRSQFKCHVPSIPNECRQLKMTYQKDDRVTFTATNPVGTFSIYNASNVIFEWTPLTDPFGCDSHKPSDYAVRIEYWVDVIASTTPTTAPPTSTTSTVAVSTTIVTKTPEPNSKSTTSTTGAPPTTMKPKHSSTQILNFSVLITVLLGYLAQ